MKIRIKKLSLRNFKGINFFETIFVQNSTNIYGDNATGKTTLMDAFLWLLFGKDSSDRKDFEIKTLDHNGRAIPKIDHEVCAVIEIDGIEHTIKRVLREKWVTRRGSRDAEMSGNETLYFWNEVPLQLKDYQAKINALVQEDVFKLLTNVLYFNSLDWQKRRSVLTQIAGTITDGEVAAGNPEYTQLLDLLVKESKTLEEYKRQLSAKRKLLKDSLESIPTRIDEANRSMPEPFDFTGIEKAISEKQKQVADVDDALQDASKAHQEYLNGIQQKQNEIHSLKSQVQSREFEIKQSFAQQKNDRQAEINSLQGEVSLKRSAIDGYDRELRSLRKQEVDLTKEASQLRIKWTEVNARELKFNEGEFCCPACNRPYETSDIDAKKAELTTNFNQSKTDELQRIECRGKEITSHLKNLESRIAEVEASITTEQEKLDFVSKDLNEKLTAAQQAVSGEAFEIGKLISADASLKALRQSIEDLQAVVNDQQGSPAENSELKARKQAIIVEIDELKKQLASRDQIEKITKRIQELKDEECSLAQQVADLEGIEFTIQKFEKAKIDALEARVNGMFSFVRFKMFEQQINGGEAPCCETLVNSNGSWVPFSDANNAAKINAGLDIINRLSQHYNVQCPVFIDNRESVTTLIDTDSQLVNLIVSPEDKKLRVA